jgi:RimJ/RimL family protein N-acetyltransferase
METHTWQPRLENELVLLRPMEQSDYEALYRAASDPLIWAQHPAYNRHKREEFDVFFAESLASGKSFVVIDKRTNQIIGSTRYYDYDPEASSIKIGFTFLDRAHWGGSFNYAKKQLLIDYAFRFVDTVIFEIAETNIRSRKGNSRFGIEEAEHFLKEIKGKYYPYISYRLTPELWKQAKRMRA